MDVKQSQGAATSTGRSDQAGQQGAAQRESQDMARRQGEPNRMARRGAYRSSARSGSFSASSRTTSRASSIEQPGRLGRPKARASETDEMLAWSPKIDVVSVTTI